MYKITKRYSILCYRVCWIICNALFILILLVVIPYVSGSLYCLNVKDRFGVLLNFKQVVVWQKLATFFRYITKPKW